MENKDTKIFQVRDNTIETKIESIEITEKQLQNFYEKNLEKLLRARFVKSELPFHGGRIDTFALDYNNNPIIIEYKKSGKSSVLQQALHYKKNIEDNSEKGYVPILKKLGEKVADKANLKNIQIVLVAQKFDKWTLSLASYHNYVRLYEYSFFKNIFIQKLVHVSQKNNFYTNSKAEEDKDIFENKETSNEKEIVNENELIDIWIKNGFDKKIIKAKYIQNIKECILVHENIYFIFKLKASGERTRKEIKNKLIKERERGRIEWDQNLNPLYDEIKVKVLKGNKFIPSSLSSLIKGNASNGNKDWRDNNNNPIKKYILKNKKRESQAKNNEEVAEDVTNKKESSKIQRDGYLFYKDADLSKEEQVLNKKGALVKTQVYTFNRMDDAIKKLYAKIIKNIKLVFPDCSIKYRLYDRQIIALKKFVEFQFTFNEIIIQLSLKSYQKSNIFKIRDVSQIGRIGSLESRIRISSDDKTRDFEISELIRLIRISHKNVIAE